MQPAWPGLVCLTCKTKLDIMPPRAARFLLLICLMPITFSSISRLFPGPIGIFLLGFLLGSYVAGLIALVIAWRRELKHPILKIRVLPKPEITLNLGPMSQEISAHLR
jgi:hypothetical protein